MTRARVKPELIRWVRKDAGLSVADAAKKAGTSEAIVRQWEEGTLQPTIRQLRLLANAAKRPIAIFYLAEPPWKFTALRDFRRLPGDPLADQSSALRLAVRLACERRQVALDLAADLDDLPPALPIRASLEEPVVVNTRDAPNGRVFTLFHEYCHLLLRKGGICDLRDSRSQRPEDSSIEVFCNAVAAETLVPRRDFVRSPLVRDYYQDRITSRDVSEYLGVRLKHMARIEERVMGSRVMFG